MITSQMIQLMNNRIGKFIEFKEFKYLYPVGEFINFCVNTTDEYNQQMHTL